MNLRNFTAVSAVAMLVLGGCVITTTDPGTGGSGGSGTGGDGNTGNTGTAGTGGTGTGGTGTGGTAGAGGMGACVMSCAAAVTDGSTPCAGSNSEKLYNALVDCSCGAMGTCASKCADNRCKGDAPSAECTTCVTDPTVDMGTMMPNGCGTEFGACSGDI